MFTRDQLITQFKMIDVEGRGSLPLDKIVVVCQTMGMNTSGHKVKEHFDVRGTQTAGEVSHDEFVQWFKETQPGQFKDE